MYGKPRKSVPAKRLGAGRKHFCAFWLRHLAIELTSKGPPDTFPIVASVEGSWKRVPTQAQWTFAVPRAQGLL